MSASQVRLTRTHDGAVAVLELHRPEKLNAIGWDTFAQLGESLALIRRTPEIRVLQLSGAGGRAFCGGADIGDIAEMTPADFRRFAGHTVETYRTLRSLPQVVVAGVDGVAYGAGCALVMAADLVLASSRARFAQPEINIGIVGGAALLPRALGSRVRAAEMVLLGAPLSAEEAERLGLINRVVAPERLAEALDEVIHALLAKPPHVLALAKQALVRCAEAPTDEAAFDLQQDLATLGFGASQEAGLLAAFLRARRRQ